MNCPTATTVQPFHSPVDFVQDYLGELAPERWNQSEFTGPSNSEWQWHQLRHMQICTSPQTRNHTSIPLVSFLQAGCPSCQQRQSTEGM